MRFNRVFIPYGAYWSSPFCRWQGKLSGEHPLKLAAACASQALDQSNIAADDITGVHFGMTVPQHQSFFGAPWIGALIGADRITGPMISQACATSARVVASAAAAVELGSEGLSLALAADRISNGPHLYYPDPEGRGGQGVSENWVWDNFNNDPYAGVAMVQTAENIASKFDFSRQAQDALTLHRYEQYQMALANGRAFQKLYMADVALRSETVCEDEGIRPTTSQGMEKLVPVMPNGTVTFAAQTHPADGNAGLLLGSSDAAMTASQNKNISVQLLSFGEARAEKAHMGMAPVPAALAALSDAEFSIRDLNAVKTHNPFAVNDLYFAQESGFGAEQMNNYGSSLIFGHPQAPTGLRLMIELIEELVLLGGGNGLFTGCAAGDTGAAVVLKVDVS